MRLFKQYLFLGFALITPSLFWVAANEKKHVTEIVFCAPQNDIFPFYITNNGQLSGINPDLIQQVFSPESLPEAKISITLRPWKRCNADLENGSVDMMIGGYEAKRQNVVYPIGLGFSLKESEISTADVCFYSIAGKQMERAKKGFKGEGPFIVGIEAGFTKQHADNLLLTWVELFNPIEKYRMLEKGRVDAIVQVCSMDGQYPLASMAASAGYHNFVKLHPPYLSNPAYPVFSEVFAQQHNELAKRIIMRFKQIDKVEIYRRYASKNM
ncbi:MAG: hypothetical protein Alis3KO_32390 [Aliiglaciecola sp.]